MYNTILWFKSYFGTCFIKSCEIYCHDEYFFDDVYAVTNFVNEQVLFKKWKRSNSSSLNIIK